MCYKISIKINTVSCTQIQQHFIDCNFEVVSMSLIDYSTKLKEFGTTIEAWCASELVGLCVCYFNNFETRTAYISHIAINPNHKRSGIGRKLINLTRNIAKSKGFSSIRLEVKENNNIAIAFYRNMGFELLNTNGNKLLMELKCFSV